MRIIGSYCAAVSLGMPTGSFVLFPGNRIDNESEWRSIVNRFNVAVDTQSPIYGLSKRLVILGHGSSQPKGWQQAPDNQIIGFFSEPGQMFAADEQEVIPLCLIQGPWGVQWSGAKTKKNEKLFDTVGAEIKACDTHYIDVNLSGDYSTLKGAWLPSKTRTEHLKSWVGLPSRWQWSNDFSSGALLTMLMNFVSVSPEKYSTITEHEKRGIGPWSYTQPSEEWASQGTSKLGDPNIDDFLVAHNNHRDLSGYLLVNETRQFQKIFQIPDSLRPLCSATSIDLLLVNCKTSVSEIVQRLTQLNLIYDEILVFACRGFPKTQELSDLWPKPQGGITDEHVALFKSRRMAQGRSADIAIDALKNSLFFWQNFSQACFEQSCYHEPHLRDVNARTSMCFNETIKLIGFNDSLRRVLTDHAMWAENIYKTYERILASLHSRFK